MDEVWQEVLLTALNQLVQRYNSPIAGAKFRNAVSQIARDRGLEFPPAGLRKFSDLIEAFPTLFIVQRRPGSDILVVPADRAELLVADGSHSKSSVARIRQDLFEALTLIQQPDTHGRPHYDPANDRVLYIKDGEPLPPEAVSFPVITIETELGLRKQFIAENDLDKPAAEGLMASLAGSKPLREFSSVIQGFGLIKRWHYFRVSHLATQLREWSVRNSLAWQPSWVNSNEPRLGQTTATTTFVSLNEERQLAELISALKVEDYSRISIPLDIVLRLLANR